MAEFLENLIGLIETALYGGHLKAMLILAGTGAAALALAVFISVQIVKSWRQAVEDDPAMARARRLELFYLDRPLRAEIVLEYPSFRARREAMRNGYPPCGPDKLLRAVREAWYNEFVKFELDRAIHDMARAGAKHPAAARKAVKLLRETRRSLPSGITTVIVTRGVFRKEWRYGLDAAHEWLDTVQKDKAGPSAAETFMAIKSGQYQCAYCRRDLNENIILKAVRTESGHAVPACTRCLAGMKTKKTSSE